MNERRIRLGVNIDHVATLRQARRCGYPVLLECARTVVEAGADGITIHLREDRRHIQDQDLKDLVPLYRVNLEMAASAEMLGIVTAPPSPAAACLVPEKREELTTEGGLDVAGQKEKLSRYIQTMRDRGVIVSLFIDPSPEQVKAAAATGADVVELHTGSYANNPVEPELKKLEAGAELAHALGLRVHAGHGLDLSNVAPIARLAHLEELNIGFSIVADALHVGLGEAVRRMRAAIDRR